MMDIIYACILNFFEAQLAALLLAFLVVFTVVWCHPLDFIPSNLFNWETKIPFLIYIFFAPIVIIILALWGASAFGLAGMTMLILVSSPAWYIGILIGHIDLYGAIADVVAFIFGLI